MKHIVVPIDFSKESINGLKLAILFANCFGSTVQMVYVQKYPSEMSRMGFAEEKKKATENFKELVLQYSKKLTDPSRLSFIVKKGRVYSEVVNQAQAFADSAIICSTHGASGFEELFIGSNAFKIISATELPVITIRHGSIVRDIEAIVLPVDASADTRQKVPISAEIAKAFGAKIHVVGISQKDNSESEAKVAAYVKQVSEFLKDKDVNFIVERKIATNITEATIKYALEVNADLISIMTEQDESLTSLVLGSYAQQMLNKSPIPVLSITPKEIFIMGSFSTQGKPY
jgi:nucleotide-binding universal stress UspA family protein